MSFTTIIWDLDDDPDGNVKHVEEHGLTKDDVEDVLSYPSGEDISRTTGNPVVFGTTRSGLFVMVVYERIDIDTVYPITAYEVAQGQP